MKKRRDRENTMPPSSSPPPPPSQPFKVLCFGNYILDGVCFIGAALFSSFIIDNELKHQLCCDFGFTEFMFFGLWM